jgi:signal transduction histidine kinase
MTCDAVGIRLLKENGCIPYQAYDGFSRQFYESESPLVLQNDQCMCIDVIKGRTDPGVSFFTPTGSFFTNNSSQLLATVPAKRLGTTRNVCNAYGYESVALIPIRAARRIIGLIHVADRQTNRVPKPAVHELELVATRLGMAIQRISIQDKLDLTIRDLGHLSTRLLKTQEEEQQRIAMELHDQTGQNLNVLKLQLANIEKGLRKDQPVLKEACQKAETFVDTIIEDVRRLAQGLSPTLLEALGLTAAVRAMADEFRRYTGIAVDIDVAALDHIKKRNTRVALYRIIQEALSNIQKHAKATSVSIAARLQDRRIVMVISDNGCGFDTEQALQIEPQKRGMGLAAIGLRAQMIRADFDLTSRPGHGTRITLQIPYRREVNPP